MRENYDIYEQIDDFLHGEMTEQERRAFEEKIKGDERLASKVEEVKATEDAIHLACLADLKKTIGEDIKKIKYRSPWQNIFYWIIAASIIAVISCSLYFIFNTDFHQKKSTPDLNDPRTLTEEYTKKNDQSVSEQKAGTKHEINHSDNTHINQAEIDNSAEESGQKFSDVVIDKNESSENRNSTIVKQDSTDKNANRYERKLLCDSDFDIISEASCKNKETGKIKISAKNNIEATFQLDQQTVKGQVGSFSALPAGEYNVFAFYNNGCTFTKTVKITEKWCPLNQSFSFNPDYNEKWEIKYESGSQGRFVIYDRAGKEIYKNTFGTGNEEWIGIDMNGNTVAVGSYVAMLYYSDGRSERVELTIIR